MVKIRFKNTFQIPRSNECGMAVLQAAFAMLFMLITFFAIINFGLLQYSACTLQAQMQGALSRIDSAAIVSSVNPSDEIKQQILAEVSALDKAKLTVSDTHFSCTETEVTAPVSRNADWVRSIEKQSDTARLQADIRYCVPLIAQLSIVPEVVFTYHLDAECVLFSQIELVAA